MNFDLKLIVLCPLVLLLFVFEVDGQKPYSESEPYTPRVLQEDKKSKKKRKSKNSSETKSLALPNEVILPVSVLKQDGTSLTGLNDGDFQVFLNDDILGIESIEPSADAALNFVVLYDNSPSSGTFLREIEGFAKALIGSLRSQDKLMIARFDDKLKILAYLMNDREKLAKAATEKKFGSGTALYDSLDRLFQEHLIPVHGRKVLFLITDGVDTTSQKSSFESSLRAAERGDTIVYPIYLDTSVFLSTRPRPIPGMIYGSRIGFPYPTPGSTKVEYDLGKQFLDDLARLSGGRPLLFQNAQELREKQVSGIVREINNQYLLRVKLPAGPPALERFTIKIRVARHGLHIFAPSSLVPENQ